MTKAVLVIDDKAAYGRTLCEFLEDIGDGEYSAAAVTTVDDALAYISLKGEPTFILADRELADGELIETSGLQKLKDSLFRAVVIVYTQVHELSPIDKCKILGAGAVRVLDKSEARRLAEDATICQGEFEELSEIRSALADLTRQERREFLAALLGANVGLTIIDREGICWFETQEHREITGQDTVELPTLCWPSFHGAAARNGPCWGCNLPEVFKNEGVVERLFLSRYVDGVVGWVSVRSTPVFSKQGDMIAVREATTRVPQAYISSMQLQRRILLIAQGLVHAGFGRARIYEVLEGETLQLVGAAARSDNISKAGSAYYTSLQQEPFRYSDCPYVAEALKRQVGFYVPDWDETRGPSPLGKIVGHRPPYFIVPVWTEGENLRGFIAVDFVFEDTILEGSRLQLGRDETLSWLQSGFAREVARALIEGRTSDGTHAKYDIVQKARLDIGEAHTSNEAQAAILAALRELIPAGSIVVRSQMHGEDDNLVVLEALSTRPRDLAVPDRITAGDARSLAATCVETRRPVVIDDLAAYRQRVVAEGSPCTGYQSEDVASTLNIPLAFEGVILGTLGIDMGNVTDWKGAGLIGPLKQLGRLVALVVRDFSLQREITQAMQDRAAVIAAAVAQRADESWQFWVRQGLARISAITAGGLPSKDEKHLTQSLNKISEFVNELQTGKPPSPGEEPQSLGVALKELRQRFSAIRYKLRVPEKADALYVNASTFETLKILQILVENSVGAMARTARGSYIEITAVEQEGFICVQVRDDGPGIPDELVTKLFAEPIPSALGKGTSLLIARGIALQCGGDLSCIGNKDGAAFELTLPTGEMQRDS